MANKYSKSNISTKAKEEKEVRAYEESKSRLKLSTRIVAIVMIVAVGLTFTIMTGLFLFD